MPQAQGTALTPPRVGFRSSRLCSSCDFLPHLFTPQCQGCCRCSAPVAHRSCSASLTGPRSPNSRSLIETGRSGSGSNPPTLAPLEASSRCADCGSRSCRGTLLSAFSDSGCFHRHSHHFAHRYCSLFLKSQNQASKRLLGRDFECCDLILILTLPLILEYCLLVRLIAPVYFSLCLGV